MRDTEPTALVIAIAALVTLAMVGMYRLLPDSQASRFVRWAANQPGAPRLTAILPLPIGSMATATLVSIAVGRPLVTAVALTVGALSGVALMLRPPDVAIPLWARIIRSGRPMSEPADRIVLGCAVLLAVACLGMTLLMLAVSAAGSYPSKG